MKLQLQTYTINKGALAEWTEEWRTQLVPLREKHGFKVLEAYTVASSNQFVWLMGFEGENWQAADQAYFESNERKTMQPDPARLIANMENVFVDKIKF
jgi:hypothetical protein